MVSQPASPAPVLPPFPRSVRTYVGRTGELARVAELLDRETLFLVYGLGGMGKSELVYKAIEEARTLPRWRDSEPLLLQVRAGLTAEHVLAQLKLALGMAQSPSDLQSRSRSQLDDDLAETARALEARPSLVFIDDIHHLESGQAAHMLGFLSRHVRESRVFVASRIEVPLPPDTPTPVVIRLQPLDARATAEMVAELARRLGIERPDATEVFTHSGGSPFFVQRLVAGDADWVASSLERSLAELAPEARALLLLVSVLRSRFTSDELVASGVAEQADGLLRELSRRFLIDVGRQMVMVHDFIRDAVARQARASERAEAHGRAARLHQRRFQAAPEHGAMEALEVVHHLIEAGQPEHAWTFAEASYPSIAAAGLDHLLLEALAALHAVLTEHRASRVSIDILRARILNRRSLVSEAAVMLERIESEIGPREAFRYWMLAGDVARAQGRLPVAEDLLRRAQDNAGTSGEQYQAALQLAYVLALRGQGSQARAAIDASWPRLEEASVRDRGRRGWLIAVSYLVEERFEEGAEAAARTTAELAGSGADDLIVLLAMLEILSRVECGEVKTARSVFDRVLSQVPAAGTLRQHMLSFYEGMVCYGEGNLNRARAVLDSSYAYLTEHADVITSTFAGYYLSRTMMAQGDARPAIAITERMMHVVAAAGLESLVANMVAAHADALLSAGQIAQAKELAEATLASERAQSNARWLAHSVLMRSLALLGDLEGARRLHRQAVDSGVVLPRYRLAADLELATIEVMGGSAERAVETAESAWHGYAAAGRRWLEARAAATLSGALLGRGRSMDMVAAEDVLARAEALAQEGQYPLVLAGCALVRAALGVRQGDRSRAQAHIMAAARGMGAHTGHTDAPEVALLRSGLQGEDMGSLPPGLRGIARMLGLVSGPRHRVVGRGYERLCTEQELTQERQQHDLVVEPGRAVIMARGSQPDSGRPMVCELLARIIEGRGAPVTAEDLFRDVWGGREYHALRHRNTVYVAVKRLRQTLRGLLGDRNAIETTASGWRIADDVDAVSIRPLDRALDRAPERSGDGADAG